MLDGGKAVLEGSLPHVRTWGFEMRSVDVDGRLVFVLDSGAQWSLAWAT